MVVAKESLVTSTKRNYKWLVLPACFWNMPLSFHGTPVQYENSVALHQDNFLLFIVKESANMAAS